MSEPSRGEQGARRRPCRRRRAIFADVAWSLGEWGLYQGCIETSPIQRSPKQRVRAALRRQRVRAWGFGILIVGGWTTRARSRFLVLDCDLRDVRRAGGDLVPGSVVEGGHRLRRRRTLSGRHALLRGRLPGPVRAARRRQRRRPAGDHLSRGGRRLLRLHARLPVHLRDRAHDVLPAGGRGDVRGLPVIETASGAAIRT